MVLVYIRLDAVSTCSAQNFIRHGHLGSKYKKHISNVSKYKRHKRLLHGTVALPSDRRRWVTRSRHAGEPRRDTPFQPHITMQM